MAGRKRRHSPDEILAILQEHSGSVTAKEVIRRHGISLDTLYRWKRKYGGVDRADLHRLKALEEENRRLKRVVADQALNLQVLKDALGKDW
jgi:putative transposase